MLTLAKRSAALAVAGILVLGGLAGCGPAAPTNTQELLERYTQAENHDNYHAVLDYDIEVSLFGQTMPITVSMDLDALEGGAHGKMTMSAMGEESQSEIYVEKDGDQFVQYASSGADEDVTWTKSELDGGSLTSELTSEDLLKDATFAATDDGYTLTVSGDKLFEAMESAGGDLSSMLSELGDDSMKEALAENDAVFTFDKDCMLTGVEYALDYEYAYDAGAMLGLVSSDDSDSSEGFTLSMNMSMSINMTIDGYGTIKAEDVVVPEDVKKDAVDMGTLTEGLTDLLDGEGLGDEIADEATDAATDTADAA